MDAIWIFALGAACLAAAALLYLRDRERYIFPVILAVIGVFLVGAQSVTAKLPGGVDVEFQRNVADTTKAGIEALTAQQQAVEALGKQLTALGKQFSDYQAEVNQRFAQLNTAPVAPPTPPAGLAVSPGRLSEILRQSEIKRVEALDANRALQQAVPRG